MRAERAAGTEVRSRAELRRLQPSRPVTTLPRERFSRLRAEQHRLPSELVIGVVLLLVALTAAAMVVFGVLRVVVAS